SAASSSAGHGSPGRTSTVQPAELLRYSKTRQSPPENTQVLEHLFQALVMEQVLALPGLPEDLGRLGVGDVPLGVARALGALGVRCTAIPTGPRSHSHRHPGEKRGYGSAGSA